MKKQIIFFLTLMTILFSCKILQDLPTPVEPPIEVPDENEAPVFKAGNTTFNHWKHSPLHVKDGQPVEFLFDIKDNELVKKVELYIYEYELYKDAEGRPSKKMREDGVWGLVETWEYERPRIEVNDVFTYTKGFPQHTNVEYHFRVFNVKDEMSERFAMFDAGTSPWEQDKILLYAASRKPMSKTINVCFFADIDYKQNWDEFLKDTERLIFDGYHANNMVGKRKDLWSFYYTRQEADGYNMLIDPANEESYPPFMRNTLITGIDAFGLLHNDIYVDRTYFRSSFNFLSSNVFTSEAYNLGTAVHETAHAVFRLSDEYNGCACFEAERGANMFETPEACQAFNEKNNFPNPECNIIEGHNGKKWYSPERRVLFKTEEECFQYNVDNNLPRMSCQIFIDIEKVQWYRSATGVCIMQDDGDRRPNNFQRTCASIINEYYEILEAGEPIATTLPPTILLNNMFGYQPVVVMEMQQQNPTQMDLVVKDVVYGVPTKNILRQGSMDLEFKKDSGDMLYTLCVNRPTEVMFHGSNGKNSKASLRKGSCVLVVPFDENLAQATVKSRVDEESGFAIRSVKPALNFEFNLLEKLKKEYRELLGN